MSLHYDLLCLIAKETASSGGGRASTLASLAQTCRSARDACLPELFATVHWPHRSRHDPAAGLLFFPPSLWPFFRHFTIAWPYEWADASPPRWGDIFAEAHYVPRHLDQLIAAIPHMHALVSLAVSCPFSPPEPLMRAIARNTSLDALSFADTPLHPYILHVQLPLKRLALAPVGEAIRVGDGPLPLWYGPGYFMSRWRGRMCSSPTAAMTADTAAALVRETARAATLEHLAVSTDTCRISAFADAPYAWPRLTTLTLTGSAPPAGELAAALTAMPALRDLRLLFVNVGEAPLRLFDAAPAPALPALASLALSTAISAPCALPHTPALTRLALLALRSLPRVPTALRRPEAAAALAALAAPRLRTLRILVEDKLTPALCAAAAARCPALAVLELERCSYHDGNPTFDWMAPHVLREFADALAPLVHLRELRLCGEFPAFDDEDEDDAALWRAARLGAAAVFAGALPTLQRIGFEYRRCTRAQRYEDAWVEWEIVRRAGGAVEFVLLRPLWYVFPEVWAAEDDVRELD